MEPPNLDDDQIKELGINPEAHKGKVISIADMTRMCNVAASRNKVGRKTRLLLLNCGYALQQMAIECHRLEERVRKLESGEREVTIVRPDTH